MRRAFYLKEQARKLTEMKADWKKGPAWLQS